MNREDFGAAELVHLNCFHTFSPASKS